MAAHKILVAPLDWGLGHATRCIPLIDELLALGQEVVIATDGQALDLLKQQYPRLQSIRLRGYHPTYPENTGMVMAMAGQLPKFMAAINEEKKELGRLIREHGIKGVISDNRYGLGTGKVPSVLITHQVNIQVPFYLQGGVSLLNKHYIQSFGECWIPDLPPPANLAGELSNARGMKGDFKYLGILSRLKRVEPVTPEYQALVLLSGPEPQRTALERILFAQLENSGIKAIIARGLPGAWEKLTLVNCGVHNYMDATALSEAMGKSEVIIARSGYSTVMDLVAAGKQALLIPTPGQTEQEYLAKALKQKGWFNSVAQDKVNLEKDIEESKGYRPGGGTMSASLYKQVLTDWVGRL